MEVPDISLIFSVRLTWGLIKYAFSHLAAVQCLGFVNSVKLRNKKRLHFELCLLSLGQLEIDSELKK